MLEDDCCGGVTKATLPVRNGRDALGSDVVTASAPRHLQPRIVRISTRTATTAGCGVVMLLSAAIVVTWWMLGQKQR